MGTTRKLAIGIGLAGGALLAAYLFTGERKKKTQEFLSKTGKKIKEILDPKENQTAGNHDIDYV